MWVTLKCHVWPLSFDYGHKFKSTSCLWQITAITSSIKPSSKTEINIQLIISQILIPKQCIYHEVAVWWLNVMQLKICGSHFTCKVADNYLNVCEWVVVVERNTDSLLPSLAVLWIASVYERNPDRKKIPQNLDSKKANDIYGIEITFWWTKTEKNRGKQS